jgi:hypothetical protein
MPSKAFELLTESILADGFNFSKSFWCSFLRLLASEPYLPIWKHRPATS